MPLTPKGRKILRAMTRLYGIERGRQVFYASINNGHIIGVEIKPRGKTTRRRAHAVSEP